MATKKRHMDDSDKAKETKEAKKVAKAEIGRPGRKQQSQKPFVHPRLCNGTLNLWLWGAKGGGNGEDTFDGLMTLLKTRATEIEKVDVGAELWKRLKPEEAGQVLERVGELPKLRWLQFSLRDSSKDATCKSLSMSLLHKLLIKAKGLQSLFVKDAHMIGTLTECGALAEVLKSHASLWHLRLENYTFPVGKVGIKDLIPALGASPKLKVLEIYSGDHEEQGSLSKDGPSSSDVTGLPLSALKDLFRDTKSLKVVRLCGLTITDDHISDMAEYLRACKTLQELLLWKTMITEKGAKELSGIITENPSLKKVNLNDNAFFSARGCQSIFDSFASSKACRVEELYIGCRNMDESRRSSLLAMVSKNLSLQKLEICFSWPPTETVATLAQFEEDLWKSLNSCGLRSVHLYNDGRESSSDSSPELLWETAWENLSTSTDEEEDEPIVEAKKSPVATESSVRTKEVIGC